MAEPWDWEEQDLINLIERQAEESTELDFKRCAALDLSTGPAKQKTKDELSKDVSAFANAAGGALLYGMIEKDHVAHEIDAGYDQKAVTREWIEQVINQNVRPKVPGLRVTTVQLPESRPGKVAFVVWVPQGTTAHQASDKRYYRRHGTECLAMEDNEIRDVMQRTSAPRISIHAEIGGKAEGDCKFRASGNNQAAPMIDFVAQNGPDAGICEYSQTQIFVPSKVDVLVEIPFQDSAMAGRRRVPPRPSATLIRATSESWEFEYHEINLTPTDMPIFPGERRFICNVTFIIPEELLDQKFTLLLWRSRPAMSETKTGAIFFQHIADLEWVFQPMTLEELEEKNGWSIELAP